MPHYKFTAKNKLGEVIKGKAEARTPQEAATLLSERELVVISVKPITDDTLSAVSQSVFGVKQEEVVNFTRQLSTMVGAGLPLAKSLSVLLQQSSQAFGQVVAGILQEVEGGAQFAAALEKYPKAFSNLYIQLVKAGEVGGMLDVILNRLADNLEKQKEFKSKTKGALIYPAIVMIAMMVIAFIMMAFVIPKLTSMYADFGAQLPFPTLILISISNFFAKFWIPILLLAVVAVIMVRKWKKTPNGERFFSKLMVRMPLIGKLVQKTLLTEFIRTMSLLLSAGIPLIQALEVVGDGVENVLYRESFIRAKAKIEKGTPFSEALAMEEQFPPILYQMVAVGEETGKLDEILLKLSEYYESETEQAVKNLTAAIEPLIMIILGIGVGFLVIAIILPIYNLTSQF